MALNMLEYAKIFQNQLDKQMVVGATSGWMEPNAAHIQYSGGNEVKIPQIYMDGLGDYDRDDGFPQGSVSLKYKTFNMTMDRGRTFQLDAMDVNETNFVASAANVMTQFQATQVIPEVDAYRYSKLAADAKEAGQITCGFSPTAANILSQLKTDLYKIWDVVGDQIPLVISMSALTAAILEDSKDISRKLDVGDFKKGEISTKVKMFDDTPILRVPSSRMKTEYIFKSGGEDQKAGGFEASGDAVEINWIITPRSTPIAISKTDIVRIFDPMTNQKANAWKIDYRKYHDLWTMHNARKGIYVNTK